jgi:glyceraldehyde 3-phosphate dehydrogenase
MAMRAPTIDVSVVDLALETEKNCTKEEINAVMKAAAAAGRLHGIMDYTEVPLVSGDYIGNPFSSIVDGTLTDVMGGNMVKLFSWYDNEWGFSNRMVDLMRLMMK